MQPTSSPNPAPLFHSSCCVHLQLSERLAPFREKLGPEKKFKEVVNAAYLDRVDLSAHGFYVTPDITGTGLGHAFPILHITVYGMSLKNIHFACLPLLPA